MNTFIKCLQDNDADHKYCNITHTEPLKNLSHSMKQIQYNVSEFATSPGKLYCNIYGSLVNEIDQQMVWSCVYQKHTNDDL